MVQRQNQFDIPLPSKKIRQYLISWLVLDCIELTWWLKEWCELIHNMKNIIQAPCERFSTFPLQENCFHLNSNDLFFRKLSMKSEITF